jgi:hypothetical protein
MLSISEIEYGLYIQNPFNMGEFDHYQSDRPFQPFAVGDVITSQTFRWGAGGDEKMPKEQPIVKVVGIKRSFAAMLDQNAESTGKFYDETWVMTDEEWWQERYG